MAAVLLIQPLIMTLDALISPVDHLEQLAMIEPTFFILASPLPRDSS